VALFLIYQIIGINAKYQKVKAERDAKKAEIAALEEENGLLEYRIENSNDPDVLEDVAREEYGYVMPGEQVFGG
jgi:cell division protein FtsB